MSKQPRVFNPQRLWIARSRRRLTPVELAERLGMKSSRMHRICLGISDPTDSEIKRIAVALDWPVEWFYKTGDLTPDWCSLPYHCGA